MYFALNPLPPPMGFVLTKLASPVHWIIHFTKLGSQKKGKYYVLFRWGLIPTKNETLTFANQIPERTSLSI